MFIFAEREKILKKALKVLFNRNIMQYTALHLEVNKVGLLPRKNNGQHLPEIQAWVNVREEDLLNRTRPYLFFDPISGWRLTDIQLDQIFPNKSLLAIKEPPKELLDVLKVLQFYCGLTYNIIKQMDLSDYSVSKRTLTIRNFSKTDFRFFSGSSDVVRFRAKNILKIKLPKHLGDILKTWVYYRGQLRGSFLWMPSHFYYNPIAEKDQPYANWLFTIFEKPASFVTIPEASKYLGCHMDTIYKRLRRDKSPHYALMYKNTILLLPQEKPDFPKFFGDF